MYCSSCGSVQDDGATTCTACGARIEVLVAQREPVSVGAVFPEEPPFFSQTYVANDTAKPVEEAPWIDPSVRGVEISRHESLIARLDEMEQQLASRLSEPIPEPAAATLDAALDEKEASLDSLSTTLDALISDLLELEISEYARPDFIHPDETGFPARDPHAYRAPQSPRKQRSIQDTLVLIALIAAVFLIGLSVGLWGSYVMGI